MSIVHEVYEGSKKIHNGEEMNLAFGLLYDTMKKAEAARICSYIIKKNFGTMLKIL